MVAPISRQTLPGGNSADIVRAYAFGAPRPAGASATSNVQKSRRDMAGLSGDQPERVAVRGGARQRLPGLERDRPDGARAGKPADRLDGSSVRAGQELDQRILPRVG